MVLASTVLAVLSGTMTWQTAMPLLAAGVVGLVWPENTALKSAAQTVAADLEAAYERYRTEVVAAASNAPQPPDPPRTAASLVLVAAMALSLVACSGQTPAQDAADLRAIACLANTAVKVASVAETSKPGIGEAAGIANVVGTELMTDPACGTVSTPAVSGP